METSRPQNSSITRLTFLVLTPSMTISSSVRRKACSNRGRSFNSSVSRPPPRIWGTRIEIRPIRVVIYLLQYPFR